MHIEKRSVKGRVKYYVAHSQRKGKKVRKTRIYLGRDLTDEQISHQLEQAKTRIEKQLRAERALTDPFIRQVNAGQLDEFKGLATKLPIRVEHLTPKNWLKFTEDFTYDTNAIEGSTLAHSEVQNIIERDRWPDKPKEEISETYG
ncbi:MAG: hypothetical protein Q8P02_00835, partial [Candidatus Micrarchaeota archaeon]|nr:hypothetical protein [Candidatus Micrarchaeota archaeon]